jgi:hypothetical protein
MAHGEEKFSSHPNTILSLEITFLSIRKKFRIYLMLNFNTGLFSAHDE